jgi:hypothetical protein
MLFKRRNFIMNMKENDKNCTFNSCYYLRDFAIKPLKHRKQQYNEKSTHHKFTVDSEAYFKKDQINQGTSKALQEPLTGLYQII